jgi:hypothetical protein
MGRGNMREHMSASLRRRAYDRQEGGVSGAYQRGRGSLGYQGERYC